MHFTNLAVLANALSTLKNMSQEKKNNIEDWGIKAGTAATGAALFGGMVHYKRKYNQQRTLIQELERQNAGLTSEVSTVHTIREKDKSAADEIRAELYSLKERSKILQEQLAESHDQKHQVELSQMYWGQMIVGMQDRINRLEAELNGLPVYPLNQPQPPVPGLKHLSPDLRSQYDYYRRNNMVIREERLE